MILVRDIKAAVCDHYKLAPLEMTSKRQPREIARPRQVAMALSREMTAQSLPAIGRLFGWRHHTTVIHAVRTVECLRRIDPEFRSAVDSVSVRALLREPWA